MKELQSEKTRALIIETATRLFARRGFYGTSISDLARETGLTKGALYHHFADKEGLVLAVVESIRTAWREAVVSSVMKAPDPYTQLEVLFDNHIRLIAGNPSLCLVMSGLSAELDELSPALATAVKELYGDFDSFIERIVRKGMDEGRFRTDPDARFVTWAAVEILRSTCSHLHDRTAEERVTRMEAAKRIFLHGIAS